MKKKSILIFALCLMIFLLSGCRRQSSASGAVSEAPSKIELNSEAEAVSRLESDGRLPQAQASGTANATPRIS
jgi:PBP1b-binding outer membrane lipoprotein LpoB